VKRLTVPLLLVVVCAVALAACRQYLPTNRYLRLRSKPTASHSTADARRRFNHDRHSRAFAAGDVTCVDCHRFDAKIEAGDESLAKELSAQAQYPGSAACHSCHGDGPRQMAMAPSACTTCHENLEPLRPQNHDIAWDRAHGSVARTQPAQCETCHRSAECIDCHQRRDEIQERVHDRNFRFFHSVAARANPMQCGSCHRQDYCRNCHEQSGLEAHR
jgi:nitrate/TMAO reductase-like tetraheme cytochrome c subunit